jgi:thioredoxin reductase
MRRADVAVVGAGPAGIAAALAAAHGGASVTLIDEWEAPGGHLRWSLTDVPPDAGELGSRRGFEIAGWATQALSDAGVTVVQLGVVWGLFEDNVLGVVTDHEAYQLAVSRVILATGATDVVYPFAGWELPGVLTGTALQRFLHGQRVIPGRAAALIGSGVWADEIAHNLAFAGVSVAVRAASDQDVRAGGDGRIEWVEVAGRQVAADCVVIALGRQPDPELAMQALCEIGYSELDGAWVPLRSRTLETSIPGVYVVGDAAGICGVAESVAEGRVAGIASVGGGDVEAALVSLAVLRTPRRAAEVERLRLPSDAIQVRAEEPAHEASN